MAGTYFFVKEMGKCSKSAINARKRKELLSENAILCTYGSANGVKQLDAIC